jgi:hypothetical protein
MKMVFSDKQLREMKKHSGVPLANLVLLRNFAENNSSGIPKGHVSKWAEKIVAQVKERQSVPSMEELKQSLSNLKNPKKC